LVCHPEQTNRDLVQWSYSLHWSSEFHLFGQVSKQSKQARWGLNNLSHESAYFKGSKQPRCMRCPSIPNHLYFYFCCNQYLIRKECSSFVINWTAKIGNITANQGWLFCSIIDSFFSFFLAVLSWALLEVGKGLRIAEGWASVMGFLAQCAVSLVSTIVMRLWESHGEKREWTSCADAIRSTCWLPQSIHPFTLCLYGVGVNFFLFFYIL
jgi:hypothetical protein